MAINAAGLGLYNEEDISMSDNFADTPHDLQNISHFMTNRFRISPPVFTDIFNPLLQEQIGTRLERPNPNDDLYSPTSPLHLAFSSSESDDDNDSRATANTQSRQIVLGLQCASAFFSGKRERDGLLIVVGLWTVYFYL